MNEEESKQTRIFVGIMLVVMIIFVGFVTADNFTKPNVRYYIEVASQGNYYTNSYKATEGFIEINDYYQGFVFYTHYTKELVLQGTIKITQLDSK